MNLELTEETKKEILEGDITIEGCQVCIELLKMAIENIRKDSIEDIFNMKDEYLKGIKFNEDAIELLKENQKPVEPNEE